MTRLEATVVPRDLYYHERAYVRGLESRIAVLEASDRRLRKALEYFSCGCNKFCHEMHKNKDDCGAYRARSALADAQGAEKEEI